jgi:hypothetical protein
MKRCLKFIGIFIIAIVFANSVSASSVTWDQIKDEWKSLIDNDGFKLKIIDTSDELLVFQVANADNTFSDIYVNFKFENDIITMNPTNKDSMEDSVKYKYVSSEDIIAFYMIYVVGKLYDVDIKKLDSEDLSNNGIIYEGNEYSYEEEKNGYKVSMSGIDITKFTIDLNKFEESSKDLVGTYGKDDNDNDDTIDDVFGNSNVSLSLGNAYSDKLDLIVSVGGVSDKNTNKCNIWLVDKDGLETLVTTIDNCVEGENTVTISNLVPDTEYSYKVELIETNSLNLSNIVYSDVTKFSTISVDNPKTGGSYIYLVFGCLFISIFTFIILFTCNDRKVKSM